MGEMYKQVGGWKGIQKDILFPLAEYQKSQGMDTSFTRLYDAYRKVDPIWRKLHEEKEAPRVGLGDLRVAEAKTNGGFGSGRQTSGMDAGAGLIQSTEDKGFGTNGSNYFPSMGSGSAVGNGGLVWPETNQGFKQSFEPGEDYSALAKRLRSYFRRPFDRWENYDAKDNSFYLDRLNTDGSSWSDLNKRQQVKPLSEPLEEPRTKELLYNFRDEKSSYRDLFGGANTLAPWVDGIMPRPEREKRPWEIAVPRPTWMDVLDMIIGRDREQWPAGNLPDRESSRQN